VPRPCDTVVEKNPCEERHAKCRIRFFLVYIIFIDQIFPCTGFSRKRVIAVCRNGTGDRPVITYGTASPARDRENAPRPDQNRSGFAPIHYPPDKRRRTLTTILTSRRQPSSLRPERGKRDLGDRQCLNL